MASAETQSTNTGSTASVISVGGTGGGGGASGGIPGSPVTTAPDLTNLPPDKLPEKPLTLSDQIAANFAMLQGLLGTSDQTTGGGTVRTVPVAVPTASKTWIWIILAVAAIGTYFLLRKKKGQEND